MKPRSKRVTGAVLALALALAGCGGAASQRAKTSSAAASTPTQAPAKVSVVMSYILTGFDAPFWVGIDQGFYKQQNLDVTAQPGVSTLQSVQAVANGAVTFGQLDGGTVMTAIDQGLPLLGVAQLFTSQPFCILVPASSNITSISQLKGKKVGDSVGNATAALLPGVLAYHHMTLKDITLVNMSNNALPQALLSHKVAAIAALTIGQQPAIELQGMKVRALLYSDSGLNQPGFGIYTSRAYAAAHPGVVKRFILGTRNAMEWTLKHQQQAVADLAKAYPTAKPKLLTAQLKISLPIWANPPAGPFDLKQYQSAEQELVKYGVLKKPVDVSQVVTNQYVGG